jgi:hypothetical protein
MAMLILFLKGTAADVDNPLPLPEKLRRIFMLRVKEAKTDEDRRRAERDLAKLTDACS